jgi:hypothetical protein
MAGGGVSRYEVANDGSKKKWKPEQTTRHIIQNATFFANHHIKSIEQSGCEAAPAGVMVT